MRIMLDTNVLISAIVFPNDRMDTLIYKAALDHRLILSSYIIDELLKVTERKFPAKAKDVDLFLTRLPYELVYTPKEPKRDLFTIRDMDDYPALYSAIVEDVDLFVTGDDDFLDVEIEKPEIITPSEFLERY
ncbi:MAG: putative toxin-antitoxin system toxin component, PIN family [Spirochaetales bacterium]|jgi:putative PIN family toxin of toxin-antitoxin system|nr:putative toxin-antitoxin system toxin component, PIN family [Spirochaetales bacterium]